MIRRRKRIIALAAAFMLLVMVMSGFTKLDDPQAAAGVPIYINGVLSANGILIETTAYVPVRAFCIQINEEAVITWDSETQAANVESDAVEISAIVGEDYLCANDRYFYVEHGIHNIDGTVMVPIMELAVIFGLEPEVDEETGAISIEYEEYEMLAGAGEFYNEDDLYWLSRLISSEAGNQAFTGKIAVGNVVLNRVASESLPDTIYDVIFDTKHGVQFSVVTTGGIYSDPNKESIIAAKICMEGYNIAGDSLYFVNPYVGDTTWFRTSRTYVTTIGEHDFYA